MGDGCKDAADRRGLITAMTVALHMIVSFMSLVSRAHGGVQVISGEEAVGRRLALEAVEAEEVLPTAMALAESISKASSTAVRTSIQSLR